MYSKPVTFTATDVYGCGPAVEDDVYTVEEFRKRVADQWLIDYDGFGYPVRNRLADQTMCVKPSRVAEIPECATHIVWYNR